MARKIRLLVNEEPPRTKSALPVPGFDALGQRVVELGSDVLKKSIDGTLQGIFELLSEVTDESATHVVTEISFSLAFDASGEVSVVSLAKGSLKGSTGLEFTIRKK
ncbi:hypothetical protein NJF44_09115 [Pseudomonas guariconensis]|uniref:hypothetical protein n=1 Tax=Pseudomonas TaxID=286 RepID=UPI001CE3EAC4|nr:MULTISPECIES: hypothetical protein [Pseudomonas]MCO7638548.1 hypothetical protein [Pseudomonas sp. S 311-6]MCO7513807.1 hypothetical protein [Pseudomonas putida]MCO7565850.1 hypothetical protein [Pseudomonas mosselii]MCO7595506.1 hypothetical protein [Pseudomonas guariconensis]MCO7605390.1 hypothetical protein [Pseudomonas guariconensis]